MKIKSHTAWYLLFFTPALFILAAVYGYPMIRAFLLSVMHKNAANGFASEFAGFANYKYLWFDLRYWSTLRNTLLFSCVSVALEFFIGLGIAVVLNNKLPFRGLVRTAAILPWALPTSLIAMGWLWMFHDQYGIVNALLKAVGVIDVGINWLGNPLTAFIALIVADVWKTSSLFAILLLAGLQAIPEELYEAHRIDGASRLQSFYVVTLPLLLPYIGIALLLRFAQAFGVFELMKVMSGGGPGGSTEMVSPYAHTVTMRYLDFGYGATIVTSTFTLLCVVLLVGYASTRLKQRKQ